MRKFIASLCVTLLLIFTILGFLFVDHNSNQTGFSAQRESVLEQTKDIDIDTSVLLSRGALFIPPKIRVIADAAFWIEGYCRTAFEQMKRIFFDPKKKALGDSLFI